MTQSPPGGPPPSGDAPDDRPSSGQPGPDRADATGHGSTGPIPTAGPSLSKDPSGGQPAGPPAGAQPPPTTFQPSYQQAPPAGYQPGPPPGYQPAPPPGYQQGPPPGYQQGPPPGYQQGPPPGYQPGPPPGYQPGPPPGGPSGPPPGYQQGPPPGYQQGPPSGFQQQPGYPPPGGGYGPPGGPPGYPGAPGAPGAYPPAPAGPGPSFDMSKITVAGWGVLGASLLTLVASFFPFWSVSAAGFIVFTVSLNGWSLWWWLPVLLAIAVGVVYALELFGVIKPNQVKPEWLVYAAAASFVLMLGVLIQTLIYAGSALAGTDGVSHGPSFGVFIAIITTAALTYFMALAAQSGGAKLPFKVPGPA